MTMNGNKLLLVLEGAPEVAINGAEVLKASDLTAANKALHLRRPEVVIISGKVEWQRTLVGTLPAEHRPAVVSVGGPITSDEADEWVAESTAEDEMTFRIDLARQRARRRRRTARRAFIDSLTQLPNRRASVRALLREAERSRRLGSALSLVLVDLDDFKAVNEEGGHPAGDRLLRRVGAALRQITRVFELCARVGGDEFAMVVPSTLDGAERAARRAKDALKAIGVSATVAACQMSPDESLRDLYRRTDRSLCDAKDLKRAAQREPSPELYAG